MAPLGGVVRPRLWADLRSAPPAAASQTDLLTTQGDGAAYRYGLQLLHRQSSNTFDATAASKYIDTMSDRAENQATTALAAATGNPDPEIGLRAVSVLRGLVESV